MKLDPEGIAAAHDAVTTIIEGEGLTDESMQAATSAYCEKAGVVMVRDYVAQSAAALLMGLSVYWDDQGDSKQAEHVEKIAKELSQEHGS